MNEKVEKYSMAASQNIATAVIKELPFLLWSFYLIGGVEAIQRIHGYLVTPERGYSLFDLEWNVAVAFSVVFLLTFFIALVPKWWIKIAGYVFVISLFFLSTFVRDNFGTRINPQILTLIAETTEQEGSEFLHTYGLTSTSLFIYGKVLLICFLIVVSEYLYTIRTTILLRFLTNKQVVMIATLFFGGCLSVSILCSVKTYSGLFKCSSTDEVSVWQIWGPQDSFTDLLYSLYDLNIAKDETGRAINSTKKALSCVQQVGGDSINLVLVIGESHIKWHSSLYGYKLRTNPLMEDEMDKGNLFVFSDVAATYRTTSDNLKNMLCCNCIGQGEKWYDSPFFPAIFKKAGFHVSFFDNQREMAKNYSFTFALNSFLYNAEMMQMSYSMVNDSSYAYDGEVIDYYTKKKQRGKCNLIVFHLKGQHVRAESRFPHTDSFCKFSREDIYRDEIWMDDIKRQTIADYDNATLYNDYVLHKIVNLYSQENTIVVYLSDHGEETYDYRDQYGRKLSGNMTRNYVKYIYEIPFLIWCSNKYIESHSNMVSKIKAACEKPFSSDNICQILFYLGGGKKQQVL